MTTLNEALHPFAFVVSEIPPEAVRDQAVIAESQTIVVGQVLGKTAVVAGVTSSVAADASNTGNGVFTIDATNPVSADAKDGVYIGSSATSSRPTAASLQRVYDPDGHEIGRVAVGGTFNNQIKFVIADGSADFAIGDAFSVTVGIEYDGDEQYAVLNPTGTDGTERAAGIALYAVTTGGSATAKIAVLNGGPSQVRGADLTWPGGITAAQKAEAVDQLRKLGIRLR